MWTVIASEVKEDKKVLWQFGDFTGSFLCGRTLCLQWDVCVLQAVKSDDSEDGAETETGEDGEEGEKDKEEKEKEEEEKTEPPLEDDTKKHGFLILSREDSTMVKEILNTYVRQFGLNRCKDELSYWVF